MPFRGEVFYINFSFNDERTYFNFSSSFPIDDDKFIRHTFAKEQPRHFTNKWTIKDGRGREFNGQMIENSSFNRCFVYVL